MSVTLARTRNWLASASHGWCEITVAGEGDCEAGFSGSWTLDDGHVHSDEAAAQGCLSLCLGCARCRYITLNRGSRDCSWYAACDLNRLNDRRKEFLSGAVRDGLPAPTRPPRRFAAMRLAVDSSPYWVALGMVARPNSSAVELPGAGDGGGDVAWRLVTTVAPLVPDPRVMVVPCPDGFNRKREYGEMQFSCFCKTAWWFRRALQLFPRARFVGKTEEDSVINTARLVLELRLGLEQAAAAAAAAASASAAGPGSASAVASTVTRPHHARHGSRPMVLYGHLSWAVHDGKLGAFCGVGDDVMSTPLPHCRRGWSADAVAAPFASGGLDVRSRALAERMASCDPLWTYLDHRDFYGDCDGLQGFFMALCLDGGGGGGDSSGGDGGGGEEVVALHLTSDKFRPPPPAHAASRQDRSWVHATVLHPIVERAGRGTPRRADRWRAPWADEPGLLPLGFTVRPAAQHLSWRPTNRSAVRMYERHREAPQRLCQHLPCA